VALMRLWLLLCASALIGCAPAALAVTATASLPPAAAAAAPSQSVTHTPGEVPERDPQARGLGSELYASDLPDDRDGNGMAYPSEACADPDRLEGCPRSR
jgi:hypothetical protein